MAATRRFLCCSVFLLIALTQLVSVDAIVYLSHVESEAPGPKCLKFHNELKGEFSYGVCHGIHLATTESSSMSVEDADLFCNARCPSVYESIYNRNLAACGPMYVDGELFEFSHQKDLMYQLCNKSNGIYCLRMMADIRDKLLSLQTDRNNIKVCTQMCACMCAFTLCVFVSELEGGCPCSRTVKVSCWG